MENPDTNSDIERIDVGDRIGTLVWGVGFSVLFTIMDGPLRVGGRHSDNKIEIPEEYTKYIVWLVYGITAILLVRVFQGVIHNKTISKGDPPR